MKTKLIETKFRSALGRVGQLFSMVAVGSGDSDLLQRVRAEPVRVGKRCRRRRDL